MSGINDVSETSDCLAEDEGLRLASGRRDDDNDEEEEAGSRQASLAAEISQL